MYRLAEIDRTEGCVAITSLSIPDSHGGQAEHGGQGARQGLASRPSTHIQFRSGVYLNSVLSCFIIEKN